MTDTSDVAPSESIHTDGRAKSRLAKRYAAERRFKYLGLGAVLLACVFLVLLMSTIVGKGIPAFTYHYVTLPLDLTGDNINAEDPRRSNFGAIIRDAVDEKLPFVSGRSNRRVSRGLVSGSADVLLSRQAADDPSLVGVQREIALPLSDTMDLYLKGLVVKTEEMEALGEAGPTGTEGDIQVLTTANSFTPVLQQVKSDLLAEARQIGRETTDRPAGRGKAGLGRRRPDQSARKRHYRCNE